LAQGEVLEGELSMATEEEREKPKQVKEKGDHRAGIVFGSKPRDPELSRSLLNLAERDGTASYPQFTAMRGIPT
jgi:hypothetical protein